MRQLLLLTLTFFSLQAMTLDESISYALENNNALKQSDMSVEHSKSSRDGMQAKNFGRVDIIASYDHYNLSRTLAPLTPMSIVGTPDGAYQIPTTQDLFSAGIAYNVVLFNGFAQQSAYKISDLQYQNAAIRSKLGREELIYNVRNLYISLLALQEQLQAQQIYTESEQKLFERIKKEHQLGSKSRLDLLRAQNSLESSSAREQTMEANIEILKASLSALMGNRVFDKSEPIAITIDEEQKIDVSVEKITGLKRYQATELNIKANAHKREQSKSGYYPVIDFGAYYGQNFGPNDTTNTVPPTNMAPTAGQTLIEEGDWHNEAIWQVGVHLKWNILDFGATSSKNRESKLAYLQAKLESDNVGIELRKNIVTAQNKIKLATAQFNSTASQYELLSETEKIEQIRYDNNALTLTDLLATRSQKSLAYAQMITAKYEYQKATYYLDYLLEKGDK